MAEDPKAVPEGSTAPSGSDGNTGDNGETGGSLSPHVEKILREKKNAMARVHQLEAELKQRAEKEMIEKEQFKTLAETREQELKDLQEKYSSQTRLIHDSMKRTSLRQELVKLGCNQQYVDQALKLSDLGKVTYDADSGVITGADMVAKTIQTSLPVFFQSTQPGVDHSAPSGGNGALTVEEWRKLPLVEMKKRQGEVLKAAGIEMKK